MKHKLIISIEEDVQETEEDIQTNAIAEEIQRFKSSLMPSFSDINVFRSTEQRKLLGEKNNSYLNQLLAYMESENYGYDYSYSMLSNIEDIASIAKSFFLSCKSCEQLLQSDLTSEWKVSLIELIPSLVNQINNRRPKAQE